MRIDARGWLEGVRRVPSENRDARPDPADISLVVVHGISLPPGEFGGDAIEALFTNRLDPDAHPYYPQVAHLRVSAHVLIRRDGSLVQFVPFGERAWHAGQSCHQGRTACNAFSVGIELEGADDIAYEPVQYRALAELIAALAERYPAITAGRVVGHSDIAPGRKTDPGPAFEWPRLAALLAAKGLA